jgi:type I restriction enzyme S subunit
LVLRDIKRICVSLPPLAEQRSIAAILDTVDEAIAKTEAVIAKLKQVRVGLLHDLLTRGLDKSRQLRDPIAHPGQFQDSLLGFLPKEWDVLPLGTVARRLGDGAHTSVETVSEGIPFLYVSCVRDGTILWHEAARISASTYKDIMRGRDVGKGTVLYTAVGSYGFAAMVPDDREFAFQRHIAYITPDFARIDARFLTAFLNSPLTKVQADRVALGNAQKTLTLSMLSGLLIAVPSRTEQQAIAQMLETHDVIIQREQELRGKLHKIKFGLMNDLLTGRVRVPEGIAVTG